MNKKQSIQYAQDCQQAKRAARAAGIPYVKPERPDATQIDNMAALANKARKNTRVLEHRMKVIIDQMDTIVDYFDEEAANKPELREYQRIADYLLGSLIEIQERITLM